MPFVRHASLALALVGEVCDGGLAGRSGVKDPVELFRLGYPHSPKARHGSLTMRVLGRVVGVKGLHGVVSNGEGCRYGKGGRSFCSSCSFSPPVVGVAAVSSCSNRAKRV